jgi:hypothetical protein
MSDYSCNCKMRAGTTNSLEVEREGDVSHHSCDYKLRAGTTYSLGVETRQCVRAQLQLQNKADMTYSLEVEREGKCQIAVVTKKQGRDDVQPGGSRGDMSDHS